MDEINVAASFHTLKQRTFRLNHHKLIPSDLRNFQSIAVRKSHDTALKDSEAGRATVEFLALLKQRLVADADAEKGTSRLNELATRFQQCLLFHRVDTIV